MHMIVMLIFEKIKRVLAVIILICFFLPLAQCTSKQPDKSGNIVTHTDVLVTSKQITYHELDDLPVIAMFAFPLGFVSVRRSARTTRSQIFLSIAETLFASWSLFNIVQIFRLWGTVRYGGVILAIAYSGYILAALFTLVHKLRELDIRSTKYSRVKKNPH
jgi:hypothetical protein